VLSVPVVQILAAVSVGGFFVGFALGHSLSGPRARPGRPVAKRTPPRWTEVAWVAGALTVVLWSVAVLLAPSVAYHWPPTPDFPFSSLIQLAGFGLAVVGGLLSFAAVRALGRHMTLEIQVQEGHRLVQTGPYRYIRHPVYTSILTGACGLSVLYLTPVLAAVFALLVPLALYRSGLEERLLASPEAFGEEYRAYVARTGRFLPRARSRR